MGSCLALFLARRGVDVTIFDMAATPMSGASRWNEGKIHLGYLYSGDPTLNTARRLLPGGLAFGRIVADLAGAPLEGDTTAEDDICAVHRDSVAPDEDVRRYYSALDALVREHPDAAGYLSDVTAARTRPLTAAERASVADPRSVVACYRVPERSVRTAWVADRLCEALSAEPRITQRMGVRVMAAKPVDAPDGPWRVDLQAHAEGEAVSVAGETVGGRYDLVFNTLWHGRLAVDRTAGLEPEAGWSNRYRVSAFVRTKRRLEIPSAVAVVGPFGDIKNYNRRDFYVSWYPAGLILESASVSPPEPRLTEQQRRCVIEQFGVALGRVLPGASEILANAESIAVEGGFVFAMGNGSIADPRSSLHRRDRFGVKRLGRYFSIDTGKYSTAPWLAEKLAGEVAGS